MKQELLRGIYDEASWLSDLVENILSLSKVQSSGGIIRKTPEVLEDVLFSAAQKTRNRYSRHKLTVQPPEHIILVPMDAVLIEQVLINMLDNAVSHTPEGTHVTLSASMKGKPKEQKHFEITVSDDGPGIPLGIMPHIFDLFKSSKISNTKSRGSGLGLGICKAIIDAHGGRIVAMNHMTGGAIFSFTLPFEEKEIQP